MSYASEIIIPFKQVISNPLFRSLLYPPFDGRLSDS